MIELWQADGLSVGLQSALQTENSMSHFEVPGQHISTLSYHAFKQTHHISLPLESHLQRGEDGPFDPEWRGIY